MTRQISLTVNSAPISLDYFVQGFVDHTVSGMVEALETTEPVKTLSLSIDGDQVAITLNSRPVTINAFVMKIVKSTTLGMISPLKGVSAPVNQLKLDVTR